MKALGVGLGAFAWRDVEVVRLEGGQPTLSVTGAAGVLAAGRGVGAGGARSPIPRPWPKRSWSPCREPVVIPVVTTGADEGASTKPRPTRSRC